MGLLYNIDDFLCREQRRSKSMENKRFLNVKEVAALLGASPRTVCAWAEQFRDSGGTEGLPHYRFGRRALSFDRTEMEDWIKNKKEDQQIKHAIA